MENFYKILFYSIPILLGVLLSRFWKKKTLRIVLIVLLVLDISIYVLAFLFFLNFDKGLMPKLEENNNPDQVQSDPPLPQRRPEDSIRLTFRHSARMKPEKDYEMYRAEGFTVITEPDNRFIMQANDESIGVVDIPKEKPQAADYRMDLFRANENKDVRIIVINAAGVMGTAWYHIIILAKNKMVEDFTIEEPRADFANTRIEDFMSFKMVGPELVISFRKDKIADHTRDNYGLQSDGKYLYMTRKVYGLF